MAQINEKVEYMYFYKEWFKYMELGSERFFTLMDLISRERFTDEDILPDSIEDLVIRSIWRSIRPSILKSRRQERWKKKTQVNAEEVTVNETPVVPIQKEEKSLEDIFRAKIKENRNEYIKWITDYLTFDDFLDANMFVYDWMEENKFDYWDMAKVWEKMRNNYVNKANRS